MAESRAAKIIFGAPSGVAGDTFIFATAGGIERLQTPASGLRVHLAFRTVRGRQPRHFEPGMVLQHLDESLSDDTSSAENTDRNLFVHVSTWNFITSDA